jgi:hypothetical protein
MAVFMYALQLNITSPDSGTLPVEWGASKTLENVLLGGTWLTGVKDGAGNLHTRWLHVLLYLTESFSHVVARCCPAYAARLLGA